MNASHSREGGPLLAKKNRAAAYAAFLGIAIGWTTCSAALISPTLSAIDAVRVEVPRLEDDKENAACGITQSEMTTAASYPLIGSGLRPSGDAGASFSVTLTTLYFEQSNTCFSAFRGSVWKLAPVLSSGTEQPSTLEMVVFWDHGGLITSPKSTHAQRMREAIGNLARDLVVNWAKNRPKEGFATGLRAPH